MMTELTHTRRDFNAKETGAEIRKALRAAFPGVTFSLRGSRGTGYGWFALSWTDGPTTTQADRVTGGFRSSYFDGMDDSTHQIPATLYALPDGSLYEPRWTCCGVNTSRDYSPAAVTWAESYINAHGGPETFCADYWPDMPIAVHRVLSGVDMTGLDWTTVPLVTEGHSGRRVASCYCVETRVYEYERAEPARHRA